MVLKLLALQLLPERGVLLLELAEAADIGPVGGTDEMGEHMHFAEDASDQGVAGKGMGQHGPIARRNIAALARFHPQRCQLRFGLGFLELADDQRMAKVERLVQHLCGMVMARREADGLAMQIVIAHPLHDEAALSQRAAQLAGREAGADDGAMQIARQLPDPGPATAIGRLGGVAEVKRRRRPERHLERRPGRGGADLQYRAGLHRERRHLGSFAAIYT